MEETKTLFLRAEELQTRAKNLMVEAQEFYRAAAEIKQLAVAIATKQKPPEKITNE